MEHPHTLLMLVLKQHYQNRLHVIDDANKVIEDYKNDGNPNYEKTLGVLYQLLNDLPPDILLYFLTLVPLPDGPMTETSTLIQLMKQMHATNLLNNMRPSLLQYLNNQVPPLIPIQTLTTNETNNAQTSENITETQIIDNKVPVQSVIDENIKKEKNKNRKKAKAKPKATPKRTVQVKSLTMLCALKVLKIEKTCKRKYENLKKEAWNIINSKNINKTSLKQCYNVIRDTNKKIKWLAMVKSGDVPLEVLLDEYGSTDVFYQQKHLKNIDSNDLSTLDDDIKRSVANFLAKC